MPHVTPPAPPSGGGGVVGQLTAIENIPYQVTKGIALGRLIASAQSGPVTPPAGLFEHGVGTKIDSAR